MEIFPIKRSGRVEKSLKKKKKKKKVFLVVSLPEKMIRKCFGGKEKK